MEITLKDRSVFGIRREVEAAIDLLTMAPGLRGETFDRFPEYRSEILARMADCSAIITTLKIDLKAARSEDEPWEYEIRELEADLNRQMMMSKMLRETLAMIPEPHER